MTPPADLAVLAAAAQAAAGKASQAAAALGTRRVTVESADHTVRVTLTYHGVLEELTIADDAPRKLGSAALAQVVENTLRAAQEQAAAEYQAAVTEAVPEIRAYRDAFAAALGRDDG